MPRVDEKQSTDPQSTVETETTTTRTVEGHVWERSRRSVAWPLAAGVLGLAALGVGQGWPNRSSIENDLTERSTTALGTATADVSVSFEGRDGVVTGTVDTEADRARILDTVRSQNGVRVALDRLAVRTPGPTGTATQPPATQTPAVTPSQAPSSPSPAATTPVPTATETGTPTQSPSTSPTPSASTTPGGTAGTVAPSAKLVVSTSGITLTGTMPDEAARDALVAAASAVAGEGNVTDRLTIDPDVAPGGLSALGGVLAGLGRDADATVTLDGGTLALDGTVGSEEARQAALGAAEAVVGDAAKVRDGLSVRSDSEQTDAQDAVRAAIAELPKITFATGSATLTKSGRETVRNVAEILTAYPDVEVQVQGHTDDRGSDRVNRELSAARARTVLVTLRGLGVERDRLTSKGFGEAKPAFPNTTTKNRAKNRRVVFEVRG
ncbi:OmpA family protein [Kineosporia sp. A_224]|uniref:OmpA family protein n=1 Tax=Kineosporia sp. A_224 TaxID=1962180 RepID=UPI000B4B3428|nr:OmpA family protein [Kineosporia sp. A_224]